MCFSDTFVRRQSSKLCDKKIFLFLCRRRNFRVWAFILSLHRKFWACCSERGLIRLEIYRKFRKKVWKHGNFSSSIDAVIKIITNGGKLRINFKKNTNVFRISYIHKMILKRDNLEYYPSYCLRIFHRILGNVH